MNRFVRNSISCMSDIYIVLEWVGTMLNDGIINLSVTVNYLNVKGTVLHRKSNSETCNLLNQFAS
jgi:hypothetical protein